MSDLAGNDDSEWTPPSEAEMKVLAARRERSDKISKVMGDYLLKGYKMLSTSCAECGTILLRDRSGNLYCVACAEVDADNDAGKDDPARVGVSSGGGRGHGRDLAALRNVVLSGSSSNDASSSEQQSDRAAPPPPPPAAGSVPKDVSAEQRTSTESGETVDSELSSALEAVVGKMSAARRQLVASGDGDLAKNKALVEFIRECAECVTALKSASK